MKVIDKTWAQGQGHEYEDIAGQAGNFAWVLDGATALVKGGPYTPRWLVEQADRIFAEGAKTCHSLPELFAFYRRHLHADDACLNLPPEEAPSFAMAAIHVAGGVLEYATLADCYIAVKEDETPVIFTDTNWAAKTDHLANEAFTALPREQQVPEFIRIRKTMNTPDGYWIGTADGKGLEHAQIARMPVTDDARIILCSDGFERVIGMFGLCDWAAIFDSRLDDVTARLRQVENDAAQTKTVGRFKKSDDVAALKLAL